MSNEMEEIFNELVNRIMILLLLLRDQPVRRVLCSPSLYNLTVRKSMSSAIRA